MYEQRAENSSLVARRNREDLKALQRGAAAAPNPGAPALTRPALQVPAGPGDQQVLAVHVPRRAREIQPLFDGANAAKEESYPLTEEALIVRRGHKGVGPICAAFRKTCCSLAKPSTPEEAFPEKVEYQTCCGAMCVARTPPRTLAGYLELVGEFARVAGCSVNKTRPQANNNNSFRLYANVCLFTISQPLPPTLFDLNEACVGGSCCFWPYCDLPRRYGIGPAIVAADVLLAITVHDQQGDFEATIFCDMKEATGLTRHHKPHQTLAMLHHVAGEDSETFEGLVLEYAVEPLRRPLKQPRSPMDRLRLGRLRAVTEQELARHLMLEVFAPAGPLETSVQKVVIRKLLFHDRCLRRVTTAGFDTAFEAVCVEVPLTQAAAETRIAELGKRKSTPAAQQRPVAAPGTATDFLAMFDEKRQRKRGGKKATLRPPLPGAQREPPSREGDRQGVLDLAALGFDVDEISGSVDELEGRSKQIVWGT